MICQIQTNTLKRMKRKPSYVFVLLVWSAIIFTGCMVGPKYTRPAETSTISYPDATKTDTSALATWFEIYHDTALQKPYKSGYRQ